MDLVDHRLEGFWSTVWDQCGVVADEPPTSILRDPRMPGAHWFDGARLNLAQNVLVRLGVPTLPVRRGRIQARGPGMAVDAWDPDGRPVDGDVEVVLFVQLDGYRGLAFD